MNHRDPARVIIQLIDRRPAAGGPNYRHCDTVICQSLTRRSPAGRVGPRYSGRPAPRSPPTPCRPARIRAPQNELGRAGAPGHGHGGSSGDGAGRGPPAARARPSGLGHGRDGREPAQILHRRCPSLAAIRPAGARAAGAGGAAPRPVDSEDSDSESLLGRLAGPSTRDSDVALPV